jgi:hypothetical protein
MVDPTTVSAALSTHIPDTAQTTTNHDVTMFGDAMQRAEMSSVENLPDAVKTAVRPLEYINEEASNIFSYAKQAIESGNELTPSEIVMLTAKSQEFMFHCQLTSNIANRTSDGIQQLFRQQG